MKLLLILLIVLKANISVAQKTFILQGKWRIINISQVISTSRDSLYYDLDKDSIYIPAEDLREAYKDGLDSIRTVDLFKSMYKSFKKCTFTFAKDSVILEYNTTKTMGTYHIKGNDTLDMHLLFEGKEHEHHTYTFLLMGELLNIVHKEDIGYSRFVLKKE